MYDEDLVRRAKDLQLEFVRRVRGMVAVEVQLAALDKTWPPGLAYPITSEFREGVRIARKVVLTLSERV